MRRTSVTAWAASISLMATFARAQWALDRFEPAPPGSVLLSGSDPAFRADSLELATRFSYADRPLVLRQGGDVRPLLERSVVLHLQASYGAGRFLGLDLQMPVLLQSGRGDPALGIADPSGLARGDVRFGARVPILLPEQAPVAAALTANVWLPTGTEGQLSGSRFVRYGFGLLVGGEVDRLSWRLGLARRRQSTEEERRTFQDILGSDTAFFVGSRWQWTLGPRVWSVGPELFGSSPDRLTRARSLNWELLLGVGVRLGDVTLSGAAGPGLTQAPGTPRFRALLSLSVDLSHDTRFESGQMVQRVASPRFETTELSLPASRASAPASADVRAAEEGEPLDTDLDAIRDAVDACPGESGEPSADARLHGCPRAVRLELGQITLLEQIRFATGKAEIEAVSEPTLRQIVEVLRANPEIARVAIDGHTDDVGPERQNLELSRRRAVSVLRWLVEHGVDERRLESRGFGPRRPLDPSQTREAREKNRRVEFQILKRTPPGTTLWKDGDAQP